MPDGIAAEFASADDAIAAAKALRALGYERLDAFTPYPVPELEEAIGVKRTRIPRVAFVSGLAGCAVAYLILWFTNAYDYPLDVGARPLNSLPAHIPIMFETTVLFASAAAFVLALVRSGLPRLHHPMMEVDGFERVSIDRFWVVIDIRDPAFDPRVRDRLAELGAVAVRAMGAAT